ncbi:TonB-dependent receptor domain-containing protein [Sphingosinicella terrae]|uniref:TonB-dependent receptor domain-containing protein n=1 Tax=Sphingosinicella terrae TaxID=2172047 RepID=UPI000E0DB1A7|nr:TonB-dependent receptor [Sphingosinicella terrae]
MLNVHIGCSARRLRCAACLSSVATALLYCGTAIAQPSAPADDEDVVESPALQPAEASGPAESSDIVVTATRTRSPFQAPSPLQVIDASEIEARGATSVVTLLQENPATSGTRANTAANGVRTQTPGQNFIDLRGLGTPRTLTLVNGRRFVPTVPGNSVGNPYQVDVNLIPSLMVERIEIVTGGASAQWGSDAIAGVANIILRRRFDGIHFEAQAGISQRGDYDEQRIGILAGSSFAAGRGHVVFSADYVRNGGMRDGSRDWADDNCYFFTDATSNVANGRPSQVLACDAQPGNFTGGGLIVSATGGTVDQRAGLVGLQFDSATAVSPFVRGLYNPLSQTVTATTTTQTFSGIQAGGQNPEQDRNSLFVGLERLVLYGHAEFEVSDALTLFAQASYGESTGTQDSRALRDQSGVYSPTTGRGSQVRIYADNPFIPDALRPFIPAPAGPPSTTAPAGQSFVMSRGNYDFPQSGTQLTDRAYTVTIGAEGGLGGSWQWDASFIHGRNDYIRFRYNSRDRDRYAQAVDAVRDADGQIVCRSTLTDPGNGCVPLNLFGQGTPSAEALDYVLFTQRGQVTYVQDAAQINLQGNPFSTWAGEVALAVGAEWRQESADSTVDARSESGVPDSPVGSIYQGEFTVIEGYAEATVPLLRDIPFAHSLSVNGAVRHANYSGDASATGGETTWKVGATWEVVPGLRLRATRSLDIRAPSLYELKVPATATNQNIVFNGVQYNAVRVSQAGNINLVPERANTFTVGASFAPRFVPSLQFSVDYFSIELNDVITTLGAIPIARNCAAGIQAFCDLLILENGALRGVNDSFLNLSSYETSGLDFVLSYARPLFNGELRLRGSATYTDRFTITTPDTPPVIEDYAGINGTLFQFAVPHWKGSLTASYEQGPFTINIQARYVGPGRNDNLREFPTATEPPEVSSQANRVGDYVVFNIGSRIRLGSSDRAELFWNIDNVFDRDPPILPNFSSAMQTNGALYDMIGRYFRFGARLRF